MIGPEDVVSLETSDGPFRTHRPALLICEARSVQIQSIGMFPMHTLSVLIAGNIGTVRTDRREVSVREVGNR